MQPITMVTNASAGSADEDAVTQARTVLELTVPVSILSTNETDDLAQALAGAEGTVVVAGGDGSVHSTVAALDRAGRLGDVVLGLVPLGTGNDFARTMGIPLDDPAAAARVVLEGVRRPVDVLRGDDGDLVVNAVHAGVGAEAGRAAEPWKGRLGRVGYAVGAVVAGVTTRGRRIRVIADGQQLADGARRVLQVAVGNGVFVGGGTPLSPAARPDDGKADVMVSFAVGPLQRLGYALRLRKGAHLSRDDVATRRGSTITVEGPDLWLNADGELVGPVPRRTWTVEPHAFTMAAPASGIPASGTADPESDPATNSR
jgi:YegS/Rv2252/BmrU family lipid kinase